MEIFESEAYTKATAVPFTWTSITVLEYLSWHHGVGMLYFFGPRQEDYVFMLNTTNFCVIHESFAKNEQWATKQDY